MQAERAPVVLRPFTNGMRSPVIAPVVRGALGIPLFFFSASTATLFAWTIDPPLTACILGAKRSQRNWGSLDGVGNHGSDAPFHGALGSTATVA